MRLRLDLRFSDPRISEIQFCIVQFLKLVACLTERMMFVDLNFCLHSKF